MDKLIEFTIPDGYIRDEENSTSYKVVYKLKEDPPIAKNWKEVCKVMFPINSKVLYITSTGEISSFKAKVRAFDKNNVTSRAQDEKLMAINQLMTVAKYLNSLNCFNDSNCDGEIFTLAIDFMDNEKILVISSRYDYWYGFKSVKRARKAIEILGEDVIRSALTC